MLKHRYDIKWVGRCCYDRSDKVWGWFWYLDPTMSDHRFSPQHAYVFWGPTGKNLSFKRHVYYGRTMDKMVRTKIDRKYNQIDLPRFCALWNGEEALYETINNKFVFHLLANDI